jgi:hypothetical protein
VHLDNRLPHLRALGVTPILLTGIGAPRWRGGIHYRTPCVLPSGIRLEARRWLRRQLRAGWANLMLFLLTLLLLPFYLVEKLLLGLDSHWSWVLTATMRGLQVCRRHQPEVIYSTGGAASAHLAAALIAKWSHRRWVAELQDPLVWADWPRRRRVNAVHVWLERLICRRADAVVFLTEEARRRCVERTGLAANSCVIYAGAESGNVSTAEYRKGAACRFAHFGSLADSRNLNTFLQALARFLEKNPGWVNRIQVRQYGTMDPAARAAVADFPYAGIFADHGRVPRQQALNEMAQADILVLVQHSGAISEETIPSKLYEYLLIGRPVLALVHNNGEIQKMTHPDRDRIASVTRPDEIEASLAALLSVWLRTHEPSAELRRAQTVAHAVGRLVQLVRG